MPAPAPPPATPEAAPAPPDSSPLYGLRDERFAEASDTSIGGYAELHYNLDSVTGPGDAVAQIDLHRMVLFVAHNFSEEVRFYAEVEVEHAVAAPNRPGEVSIEQAFLDYLLLGEALGLRAGVVLVPMGILNQWHEPPIFNGVERDQVERQIIPTTWREGGLGVFGQPIEGLRYELYLVSGLDPLGFTADNALRGGRQQVAEARANGLALTGRVEVEPVLGLVAGIAGYAGLAGPNADLFDAAGEPIDLDVPVIGGAADVRFRRSGLEARAVGALFGIGDTAQLRRAFDADGRTAVDVGSMLWGALGEVAYDVLFPFGGSHQLLPFVRLEYYDTLAAVSGRPDTAEDEAYGILDLVVGLSYRPLPAVVFKTDFVLANPDGPTESQGQWNLGLGLMF